MERFITREDGETILRIPVSYLLKLALAEVLGSQPDLPQAISSAGVRIMSHFLNDNTSPETFSFQVTLLRPEDGLGLSLAREKAKRFLLSQLLVMYANRRLAVWPTTARTSAWEAASSPKPCVAGIRRSAPPRKS